MMIVIRIRSVDFYFNHLHFYMLSITMEDHYNIFYLTLIQLTLVHSNGLSRRKRIKILLVPARTARSIEKISRANHNDCRPLLGALKSEGELGFLAVALWFFVKSRLLRTLTVIVPNQTLMFCSRLLTFGNLQ